MKRTCPGCKNDADLFLAVIFSNENISSEESNWKLSCGCGLEIEGVFTTTQKAIGILLYLAPVAALWSIFLIYGGNINPAWLRLVIWLIHIAPGIYFGDKLSTFYGARIAGKGSTGWNPVDKSGR